MKRAKWSQQENDFRFTHVKGEKSPTQSQLTIDFSVFLSLNFLQLWVLHTMNDFILACFFTRVPSFSSFYLFSSYKLYLNEHFSSRKCHFIFLKNMNRERLSESRGNKFFIVIIRFSYNFLMFFNWGSLSCSGSSSSSTRMILNYLAIVVCVWWSAGIESSPHTPHTENCERDLRMIKKRRELPAFTMEQFFMPSSCFLCWRIEAL